MCKKKTIIASIIAFFGVFLILGVTESNISISTSALLGDFLILLSTIAIVFHILSTEKFSPQTDPVGMLLFQLVLSTILSILAMFIFNEYRISYFLPSEWDLTIWITLIVTVLFATLFGYFVQIYYQHKEVISGSRIALLLSFEPIFAAFIGFLFFAEVLTLIEYVGGFLVFSALIISRAENPKEKNVYFDP